MRMETELSCQAARTLVSAYMNQELDAEHAQAVEAHIQGCPSCPALYASLLAVQHRLRAAPHPALSPAARERIAERVREALRTGHGSPSSPEGTTS
jgi:RNA polymerase sigma-70 factor, ECF subfamily